MGAGGSLPTTLLWLARLGRREPATFPQLKRKLCELLKKEENSQAPYHGFGVIARGSKAHASSSNAELGGLKRSQCVRGIASLSQLILSPTQ